MKRTEIATLGEFGLIRHLTDKVKLKNESSRKGIGDDAAVIAFDEGYQTLVTSDLLLEGIHFDLSYTPLKHLGYKAAVVNFSDIYAMNGSAKQLIVSMGISKRFSVEDLEELYSGILLACENYGVDLVGGDTSASLTGLCLSLTCIGQAKPEEIVYRNGAKDTDLICCTGNLGAAYMGLQLLEREKAVFEGVKDKDFQPDFSGREYILMRQLKPEARQDIVTSLRDRSIKPSAMMDISDGLSSELLHIAKQSNVGIRIYDSKLPIDHETIAMAEQLHINPFTAALNGGEDYELLFTVPLGMLDKVQQLSDVHLIGHVTKAELGCVLVAGDSQEEIPLKAQGWTSI